MTGRPRFVLNLDQICGTGAERDDLPLVAKLADQAHTFTFERLAELKFEQSE